MPCSPGVSGKLPGPEKGLPPEINSEQSKARSRGRPAPLVLPKSTFARTYGTLVVSLPVGRGPGGGNAEEEDSRGIRSIFFTVGMFSMCTVHLYTSH